MKEEARVEMKVRGCPVVHAVEKYNPAGYVTGITGRHANRAKGIPLEFCLIIADAAAGGPAIILRTK